MKLRTRRVSVPSALLAALTVLLLLSCSRERIEPDGEPPSAVRDLSAISVSPSLVALRWTAPGDDSDRGQASGYEVRYDTRTLEENGWETQGTVVAERAPRTAGSAESLSVAGLPRGRGYLALRTRDEVPNWSPLSNVIQINVPVGDTTAPSTITSLGTTGSPGPTFVVLTWIAPGDDRNSGQADHYEIREHSEPFTDAGWDTTGTVVGSPSAQEAGRIESFRVEGLVPETTYYFAVRAYDEAGNRSGISNQPPFRTASLDPTPPAAVTDLAARLDGLYDIVLTWTASADDGRIGTPAFAYDLRTASSVAELGDWESATPIAAPAPAPPGTRETLRLTGLPSRTAYAFGVEVLDDSGNRSERSNLITISTSDSSCVVRPDSTGDYATIGQALALGGGCEIVLEGGVYRGDGNAVWPTSTTRRIRSSSGSPGDCVIDFGGRVVSFPPALDLSGVTLRSADKILLLAADASGFVLEARNCAFDDVAFGSEQSVVRGPVASFSDCEFRRGTTSPILSLGEIDAVRCSFVQNEARLAIAYRSEWVDCVFEENVSPSGALLRSFNDLEGPNRFHFQDCRFTRNRSAILGPQNGLVEVEDCLFERNTDSCLLLIGQSTAKIVGATFVRNDRSAGSCIRTDDRNAVIDVERSIFVGNTGGPILDLGFDYTLEVACTDIFGNASGDWSGPLTGRGTVGGNFSLDPLFCSWPEDDYALRESSPCAPAQQPKCGRIGGLEVACEP